MLQQVAPAAKRLLALKRSFSRNQKSIAHDISQLAKPDVKVVLKARPHVELVALEAARRLAAVGPLRVAESCSTSSGLANDGNTMGALAQHFPDLAEHCKQDVREICSVFEDALGCDHVEVKLEVVRGTPCTKFHMDHVQLRALCTYIGPGTVYVPSEACVVVGGQVVEVLEEEAAAAGTGDVVFLKGSRWAGQVSAGAVHRSPLVQPGDLRLVLTVDTCC